MRVSAYKNALPGRQLVHRIAFPQRQKHQQQQQQQLQQLPFKKQPQAPGDAGRTTTGNQPGGGSGKPGQRQARQASGTTTRQPQLQRQQQTELEALHKSNQRASPSWQEQGHQQEQQAERQLGPAQRPPLEEQPEASTSGGADQSQRLKHGKLQAGQHPKTARDWQAKRDWLIMSMEEALIDDDIFAELAEELDLEEQWRPQISLLYKLGMRKVHLSKVLDSRLYVLKLGVPTLRRKLQFLRTAVGLTDDDICRLLVKFPRILEYKTEKTIRSHLDFFCKHGVEQEELPKVVLRAPMLLELSISKTLQPRIQFLTEVAAVPLTSIGKLITRHPQVMTCTEEGMLQRVQFLQQLGMDRQAIGKAVLAHPQILHYSIAAMEGRAEYLRSIGMSNEQLAAATARLPQLFSLDIRNNLVPKYDYLVQQLGGDVSTLSSYPAYLSLSLSNRIIPRHKFLEVVAAGSAKNVPRPFPMSYLKCSDKKFAHDVAGSSLQRFEAFRTQILSRRV